MVIVLWIPFNRSRVVRRCAVGAKDRRQMLNGTEVYFQARPVHPIETDDRLTVVGPGLPPNTD